MPGLIAKRYEPIELAGAGGQGEVWKALDHQHDRPVAVKIRRVGSGTDRRAILSEARILLDLRPHPGLPLVRDDFFDGDRYVLVMDWIDGRHLGEAGPLEPDETLGYLAQVAEALDHLHAHQPPVVHGDVKPANVIVTLEGRAVLVDFGIAAPGTPVGGTAGYVAPEVGAGRPPTPAADVFSLAATAVALITGRPPAPGERPTWTELPAEQALRWDLALRQALSIDPTRRPPSASALIDAIWVETSVPHNLPNRLSSFVGRDQEMAEVTKLLEANRLVTLTGAGGVGKTRLAVESARQMKERFADGAWVVGLAALSEPELIPQALAAALGLLERPGREILDVVRDHLRTRHLLLVVDNCEHLVDAVAEVIEVLLAASARLVVLATSREPLRLGSEMEYRVPSLEVPASEATAEFLQDAEAARLFLDRAIRRRPDFAFTPQTAKAVGEICRRLDGIPLAIELAAARMNVLSVEDIAARLGRAFDLLVGGERTALERQRTLRGALDWSYDMLSPEEQNLFRRLSVFAGGFTLDAAQAVCPGEGVRTGAILDLLQGLVEKSLVEVRDGPEGLGYDLLEMTQQYAEERLGEEVESLRHRHLEYFVDRAAEAERSLDGPEQEAWLARLEADHDNIRAALGWSLRSGRWDQGARMAAAIRRFWSLRGHWSEGNRWVSLMLEAGSPLPTDARAKLLSLRGHLDLRQGRYRSSLEALRASLAISRELHDERWLGEVLTEVGWALLIAGELDEAERVWADALHRFRDSSHDWATYQSLYGLGILARVKDDYEESLDRYEEALLVSERLGNQSMIAQGKRGLASVRRCRGEYELAETLFVETLHLAEEIQDHANIAEALLGLAEVMYDQGDQERAEELWERCLELAQALGFGNLVLLSRLGLGSLKLLKGDVPAARHLFAEAASTGLDDDPHGWACVQQCFGTAAVAAGDFRAARGHYRDAIGVFARLGDRVAGIECLEGLSGVDVATGHAPRAASLLGAVEALRTRIGAPRHPVNRPAVERDLAAARQALGADTFQASWEAGSGLSLERTVALALGDQP